MPQTLGQSLRCMLVSGENAEKPTINQEKASKTRLHFVWENILWLRLGAQFYPE